MYDQFGKDGVSKSGFSQSGSFSNGNPFFSANFSEHDIFKHMFGTANVFDIDMNNPFSKFGMGMPRQQHQQRSFHQMPNQGFFGSKNNQLQRKRGNGRT